MQGGPAVAAALFAAAIVCGAGHARGELGWQSFRSDGYPLAFEYPSAVFRMEPQDPTAVLGEKTANRVGRVFVSADGRATLQVGAFENVDRATVATTHKRAMEISYADARIEYDRLTNSWFVLSGTRNGEMFYERAQFSCGGRRVDVWTMTYPTAERGRYDRIVEDMARRFRPRYAAIRCD